MRLLPSHSSRIAAMTTCTAAIVSVFACYLMGTADDQQSQSAFPQPTNSEADTSSRAMSPPEAAAQFQVPDGFRVSVFAAEPDVQNPIAMTWDHRGRLWVAENYTYADRVKKFDLSLRDRVLIFEDTDGDGRFDKRTIFTDDLQMLASIELGYGGVWLLTPPQLIFIPDRNEDDRPDGPSIVMLDGFTPATDNHHTFANGLKWGPDGWLYGRCGASSPGKLGVPGSADAQRIPLNGGVWRFRPSSAALGRNDSKGDKGAQGENGLVEVLAHGTTNPWGMDWNEYGDAFFINTVNGHLWHMIPGAHFRRPHSEDPNPYVYTTIDTHADHYHWDTGKDWTDSRKVTGEHDRLGGGHAHCGATIYLGDNWPESFRGRLLTLNLHGRRVNVERLEREGCGYVGRHEPDILKSADPWFRGIDLSYGPDGAVYVLDWSDTGECHDATGVHRTSGRIYRVTHEARSDATSVAARPRDLKKLSNQELVGLHQHRNEWYVRQSRRILAQRLNSGENQSSEAREVVVQLLRALFDHEANVVNKLRALHSLYILGGADKTFLLKQLDHDDEHVRAWAVRLLTDRWPLDTIMGRRHPAARPDLVVDSDVLEALIRVARNDGSGLVRLALSSTLQRLPNQDRLPLARSLASRAADAEDHDLPLMVWYGIMPLAGSGSRTAKDDGGALALAEFANECQFPITRQLISRRIGEMIDYNPKAVEQLLATAKTSDKLKDVLTGLTRGFSGRHKLTSPANWAEVQKQVADLNDAQLDEIARDLSVLFGDGRALDAVEKIALDGKAELPARRTALKTLIESRSPNRRKICEQLLNVRYLNTTAVQGLTEFDDASIGDKLARNYRSFFPSDRPAVLDALVSRVAFAGPLLDQIAAGKIPRSELTVLHARQIRSLRNEKLDTQLAEVWGELRDSPEDKQRLMAKLKEQLTPAVLQQADLGQGRALFAKVCGNCHRLYGHGAQIGPDLTGSGRQNLDYVLLNLIDPSAAVGADYRVSIISMNDGRVLTGIVGSRTPQTLTLQTAKEKFTLEKGDIDEEQPSSLSLMPDGQLLQMTEQQIRNLVAYLMHPTQVPLPAGE